MIDAINIIINTEKGFSIKTFVLNRFSNDDIAVKVNALMPIKVFERISNKNPVKKPVVSEPINVDVKLI